jgi:hypothetical protein
VTTDHEYLQISDHLLSKLWEQVALPDEAGCMLWTAGQSSGGYGQFWNGVRRLQASRLTLLLSAGLPPQPDMHAAHSCRNRHCVAPGHLAWETVSENNLDKVRDDTHSHGSRSHNAKLTEDQVLTIRALQGISSSSHLAAQYGVSYSLILQIWRRQIWAHLPPIEGIEQEARRQRFRLRGERHPNAKLTADQVDAIREHYAAGGTTHAALASHYGVSSTEIGSILSGHRWRDAS